MASSSRITNDLQSTAKWLAEDRHAIAIVVSALFVIGFEILLQDTYPLVATSVLLLSYGIWLSTHLLTRYKDDPTMRANNYYVGSILLASGIQTTVLSYALITNRWLQLWVLPGIVVAVLLLSLFAFPKELRQFYHGTIKLMGNPLYTVDALLMLFTALVWFWSIIVAPNAELIGLELPNVLLSSFPLVWTVGLAPITIMLTPTVVYWLRYLDTPRFVEACGGEILKGTTFLLAWNNISHTYNAGTAAGFVVAGTMLFLGVKASTINTPERDKNNDEVSVTLIASGTWLATWVTMRHRYMGGTVSYLELMTFFMMFATIIIRLLVSRILEGQVVRGIQKLIYDDTLTEALNRRALTPRLSSSAGWLISIDLDGFKIINDVHGHDIGDDVLIRFVKRVQLQLSATDEVFRLGGDEFAVVSQADSDSIRVLADKLLHAGRDPYYEDISVSIGVGEFTREDNPEQILRDVDMALQQAKMNGKNRVIMLSDDMVIKRQRELDLIHRLNEGAVNRIYIDFQPFVNIANGPGEITGCEALARWWEPDLGNIPPGEFIPLIEKQELINQLGLSVLRQGIAQADIWRRQGKAMHVSVNLSTLQLHDKETVDEMHSMLVRSGQTAVRMVLEVTESVVLDDEIALAALTHLRQTGCRIAIDDFGTEASNLTRLSMVAADILKIDRSLLSDVENDKRAEATIKMAVRIGRKLNMTVVVEGVETPSQLQVARQLGIEIVQGYYFYKPIGIRDFPELPQVYPIDEEYMRIISSAEDLAKHAVAESLYAQDSEPIPTSSDADTPLPSGVLYWE